MLRIRLILKLSLIVLVLSPSLAIASEIILKSGQKVEGNIVDKTDKFIKIDSGVSIPITYYADEIDSVDGQKFSPMPMMVPSQPPSKNIQPTQEKGSQTPQYPNNSVASEDEINEFSNILTSLLTNMQKVTDLPSRQSVVTTYLSQMNEFKNKYPGSKFIDEANYVYTLIEFVGAVNGNDKNVAIKDIRKIEDYVKQHPDGHVSDEVKKIWRDSFGPKASGVLGIPYSLILDYMNGFIAVQSKDDSDIVKYYSLLKDGVDFNNEYKEQLSFEIYASLGLAYMRQNSKNDLENLVQDVSDKFPENSQLKQILQTMLSKTT